MPGIIPGTIIGHSTENQIDQVLAVTELTFSKSFCH